MPPKPKCTKEEIAAAALKIVRTNGLSELTARKLGSSLGTSATPIFTFYNSMEEVKFAARELALIEFKEYIGDYMEYTPAFKRIGMMIVFYGMQEPELFKLLFMQEHAKEMGFAGTLDDLGEVSEVCTELVKKDYGLNEADAKLLWEQMWIHAFGMGAMCAMGVASFTQEEIVRRQAVMFAGMIMLIKSGKANEIYLDVEKNTENTYHGMPVGNHPYTV